MGSDFIISEGFWMSLGDVDGEASFIWLSPKLLIGTRVFMALSAGISPWGFFSYFCELGVFFLFAHTTGQMSWVWRAKGGVTGRKDVQSLPKRQVVQGYGRRWMEMGEDNVVSQNERQETVGGRQRER